MKSHSTRDMRNGGNTTNTIMSAALIAAFVAAALFARAARGAFANLAFPGAFPGERGFGGMITYVRPCTCSGGWLLTISPPAPGKFLYKPSQTKLFPFGNLLKKGPFVLGSAKSPGANICQYGSCADPSAEKPDGVIRWIGTSR